RVLRTGSFRLLQHSRGRTTESAAFDRRFRSWRYHSLRWRKPISGRMERRSDGALDQQMLRPSAVGLLLACRALPVRYAAIGKPGRYDLWHNAADTGVVGCRSGASLRLSQPPRNFHVAIPRPFEPRVAGLGLARSHRRLRP